MDEIIRPDFIGSGRDINRQGNALGPGAVCVADDVVESDLAAATREQRADG